MNIAQSRANLTWSVAQDGARAFSRSSNPIHLLGGAIAAADVVIVLMASTGAYVLRHGDLNISYDVASIILLAAMLTLIAMHLVGSYSRYVAATSTVQIGRAVRGWSSVFLLEVVLGYLTKTSEDFSRTWAIGSYVAVLLGVAVVRMVAATQVRRWRRQGKLMRTVAIVNLTGLQDDLAQHLRETSKGEMRFLGTFLPYPALSQRNGVRDLIALSRLFRIDDVVVVVSGEEGAQVQTVLRTLGTIPTNVHLCPRMPVLKIPTLKPSLIYGQPVMTVSRRPLMGWNRIVKRAEDVVLSLLALIVFAPLIAIVAVLIKLETPGPALFRQKRLGFNNEVITVYKFRSMIDGRPAEAGVLQARRNDPRVTRVGRIIRRTSIDELPQIINVLQGRMSLVGPRPHALAHNDQYAPLIDGYLGRHRVQPGITGWAQVSGFRGETDTLDKMQRRVEYDLAYIDEWSLLFDLRVLFLTVTLILFDRNAY